MIRSSRSSSRDIGAENQDVMPSVAAGEADMERNAELSTHRDIHRVDLGALDLFGMTPTAAQESFLGR